MYLVFTDSADDSDDSEHDTAAAESFCPTEDQQLEVLAFLEANPCMWDRKRKESRKGEKRQCFDRLAAKFGITCK